MVIIKKQEYCLFAHTFHRLFKMIRDLLGRHFGVKIGHYISIVSFPKVLRGILWSVITFSWFVDTNALWVTVKLQKYYKNGWRLRR